MKVCGVCNPWSTAARVAGAAACVVSHALRRARVAVLVAAVAALGTARAATSDPVPGEKVPRQIPYRGTLELNGVGVTDPGVSMQFELCVSEGGTGAAECPWSETQVVSVQAGNFSVALGDSTSNPIPARLFAQPRLYVGISVNGQKLQGRQRVLAVPYAHYSGRSNAVPVGTVVAFVGATPPDGWLLCDGAPFDPTKYPALQALLGSASTPDLTSRFLVGAGQGTGLSRRALGERGGEEAHALTESELPSHTHLQGAHAHGSDWYAYRNDSGGYHAPGTRAGHVMQKSSGYGEGLADRQMDVLSATAVNQHAGGNQAHATMPPFVVVNWIVKAVE